MKKETGKKVRLLCRVFFAGYILLLIYLMFFSEEWGRSILGGDYRYNLVPFGEIRGYVKSRGTLGSWRVVLYLAGYGVGRFWIESLRTDQLLLPGIHVPVSQMLSAVLVIVSLSVIICKRRKNRECRYDKRNLKNTD